MKNNILLNIYFGLIAIFSSLVFIMFMFKIIIPIWIFAPLIISITLVIPLLNSVKGKVILFILNSILTVSAISCYYIIFISPKYNLSLSIIIMLISILFIPFITDELISKRKTQPKRILYTFSIPALITVLVVVASGYIYKPINLSLGEIEIIPDVLAYEIRRNQKVNLTIISSEDFIDNLCNDLKDSELESTDTIASLMVWKLDAKEKKSVNLSLSVLDNKFDNGGINSYQITIYPTGHAYLKVYIDENYVAFPVTLSKETMGFFNYIF